MKTIYQHMLLSWAAVACLLPIIESCALHSDPKDSSEREIAICAASYDADQNALRARTESLVKYDALRAADGKNWFLIEEAPYCPEAEATRTELRSDGTLITSLDSCKYLKIGAWVYDGNGSWKDNKNHVIALGDDRIVGGSYTDLSRWNAVTEPDGRYLLNPVAYWPNRSDQRVHLRAFGMWDGIGEASVLYDKKVEYDSQGNPLANTQSQVYTGFFYTSPYSLGNQGDIVMACQAVLDASGSTLAQTLPANYNRTVAMRFFHPLTAIRIKLEAGFDRTTVRNIIFKNIYEQGACYFDDEIDPAKSLPITWKYINESSRMPISVAEEVSVTVNPEWYDPEYPDPQYPHITGGDTTLLFGDDRYLFVVPQKFGSDATMEIELSDGSFIKASLAGREWKPGTVVTYHLSRDRDLYELEVPETWETTYQGGNGSFNVVSRKVVDGVAQPFPYDTYYSTDGGNNWTTNAPTWLQGFSPSAPDASQQYAYTFSIPAQSLTAPNAALLAAPEPVGTVDLSIDENGLRTTANCYLVHAAGNYSLPLVYGNGIKYGKTNYGATPSGCRNHLNKEIYSNFIYRNEGCIPKDATLIWNDGHAGLVTDVRLNVDKTELLFRVPRESITQGNAVVAVRDTAGLVMWSWHIWITGYRLGEGDVTVSDGTDYNKYTFMPHNLGWVSTTGDYLRREVRVRFKQKGGGCLTKELLIVQKPFYTPYGYNVLYQFGRKDPMLPGYDPSGTNPFGDTDLPFYTTDGRYGWRTDRNNELPVPLEKSILNPNVFYLPADKWSDFKYYSDLWMYNYNGKTIYDPSPRGYKVPRKEAYGTFSITNADGAFANGWNFYSNPNHKGETLFFPCNGYRGFTSGGAHQDSGVRAFYRTNCTQSGSFDPFRVFIWEISSTQVKLQSQGQGAGAFNVRSIRE